MSRSTRQNHRWLIPNTNSLKLHYEQASTHSSAAPFFFNTPIPQIHFGTSFAFFIAILFNEKLDSNVSSEENHYE